MSGGVNECGVSATSGFVKSYGVQVMVEAHFADQLSMGALLDETAFVQHENAIGPLDRGQTMGDDKGRTAFHHPLESLLHKPLRFGVE